MTRKPCYYWGFHPPQTRPGAPNWPPLATPPEQVRHPPVLSARLTLVVLSAVVSASAR